MAFSIHGIHLPHRKNTQSKDALRMDAPSTVVIPMSMHIGAFSVPVVKVGDTVKVGTKIADAGGVVSVPAHSSVSGKVTKIQNILSHNGGEISAIVIESDGEMAVDENVKAPIINSRESLINAVRESGTAGLGGAGFPTHVKLNADSALVEYLVINGAECEPYVTSDTYTMTNRADDMEYAIRMFAEYLGFKNVIIGIESDKKEAISSMQRLSAALSDKLTCNVKVLPSIYPQGGEKVLVYNTTGRIISEGKLPIDVGCIVLNCTTVASLGSYFKTGMPLCEKCVTVDGGAVKNLANVIAPIGTKISDIIDFCGGLTENPEKIIYGGPMMGITVPGLDLPIMKNTNALLALTEKEAKTPKETACIRCGKCADNCPFKLSPFEIAKAYEKKDAEKLEELSVNTCMECGCCGYVCPANRPLVQIHKLAKIYLKQEKAKEETK